MSDYKYPCIVGASYLGGFKLLIEWSTGEMCVFDASSHLRSGSGLLYRSEDLFKQFHFDDHLLYWGDEDFVIMRDDIYENSTPCFVDESSNIFLSMARVRGMSPFPINKMPNVRAYVHGKDADQHKIPHVHVSLGKGDNMELPFTFDGHPVSGISIPNPPFSGKVLKNIEEWILKNIELIMDEWKKENG